MKSHFVQVKWSNSKKASDVHDSESSNILFTVKKTFTFVLKTTITQSVRKVF